MMDINYKVAETNYQGFIEAINDEELLKLADVGGRLYIHGEPENLDFSLELQSDDLSVASWMHTQYAPCASISVTPFPGQRLGSDIGYLRRVKKDVWYLELLLNYIKTNMVVKTATCALHLNQ